MATGRTGLEPLGSITTFGRVWTDILNGTADAFGILNLSHAYLKKLASLVPGAYVYEHLKPTSWWVAKGGTYITIPATPPPAVPDTGATSRWRQTSL